MNLLDNELIRKFFACSSECRCETFGSCEGALATRVLTSMQEPIKKGDKYILCDHDGVISLRTAEYALDSAIHSACLRLPDRFQPSVSKVQKQNAECIKCHRAESLYCKECFEGEVLLVEKCVCPCCKGVPHLQKECHYAFHLVKEKPEKCHHENHCNKLPCPDCGRLSAAPKDQIEETIQYLHKIYNQPHCRPLEDNLRALVNLVRKSLNG